MVAHLFPLSVAALLAASLTPLAAWLARRTGAIDRPGAAKIHTREVPRLGGVAVVVAAVAALLLSTALGPAVGMPGRLDRELWMPVFAGGAIVFALGVWDDVRSGSPLAKLAVQIVAAGVASSLGAMVEHVTFFGTTHELGPFGLPLTVLWIVGVTNAFNLIDGLDGLATGIASIASATGAAICVLRGDAQGALVFFALVGATLGFLPFNVTPAHIFLGDSGSLTLGFVLAVASILRWQKGATAVAVLVPLLVFGLPIADTGLSILRRFVASQLGLARSGASVTERVRGLRRVVEPDTGHIHHQLLRVGLSQRDAVLLLCGASLCLALLALYAARDVQ